MQKSRQLWSVPLSPDKRHIWLTRYRAAITAGGVPPRTVEAARAIEAEGLRIR